MYNIPMKKEICIGADHAGFELKQELVSYLKAEGYTVTDFGAEKLDSEDDYPAILAPLGMTLAMKPEKSIGVVIGGSGTGEAIVMNRFPGVRSAVFYGEVKSTDGKDGFDIIRLAREHNDANVLSIGARFVSVDTAKKAVKIFLETPFSAEDRHARRIAEIDEIE
jgi:ribose 5-phosphate isomerase B